MNGNAGFVNDLSDPALLQAITIRSPSAKGRILGIDVPNLPSSYLLIRASDIPGLNRVEAGGSSMPILADTQVQYIGEPVALIVGPDPAKLESLAEACTVRIKTEKARFEFENFSTSQLAAKRKAVIGNPDNAFKQAAQLVEGVYRTGRQEHWYPEPQGAFARFTNDKLEVKVATQWPFHVRQSLAKALNLKLENIIVSPLTVIANLDGKLWYPSLLAAQAALAAQLSGQAVRLSLSRHEDVLYSTKRPEIIIHHKAALDATGHLLGLESRIIADLGAHAAFAAETIDRLCLGSIGAYHCPNQRLEGFAIRTNNPPSGPFAGFGLSSAFFAIERQVSRITELVRADPTDWRQRHMLSRNTPLPTGALIKETVPFDKLIDKVVTMSDYKRKWAAYELVKTKSDPDCNLPRRGIGLALAYQSNGFIASDDERPNHSVSLTLEKDGRLEIRTSATSGSGNTAQLWLKAAAEILGIDEQLVSIAPNRSDQVPDSGPSTLSRNITIITKLIERCCMAIQKQRFRDPLPITVQRSYRVRRDGAWDSLRLEGRSFPQFSWAAGVVEIEFTHKGLAPFIRAVWLAVDAGRILSEAKARSALAVAIQHALGWARRENLKSHDGRFPAETAACYDLPAPSDQPPIDIAFLETDSAVPKGIGELAFNCLPAAYAAAVSQAFDQSFDSLPINQAAVLSGVDKL